MLISAAYAAADAAVAAPSAAEAFAMNMGLILLLVVMFYFLLIRPQQKRFKEHRAMIDNLKKGDKVLTAGGFIATVDSINAEKNEVVVDLGHGTKATALRATIQTIIADDKK
jgi:preprotein translocase subunit YajC